MLYILLDVPAEFRKGKGIRYQTTDIPWIIEKATEFQKKKCPFHHRGLETKSRKSRNAWCYR